MPSGRTHDRITLWSLPAVAGLAFALTRSSTHTLLVAGGFLFGGLMFGPDLDIYSQQYLRWGWLRWIWLPYQKSMRHRSVFSHGPLVGSALRVVYLACFLAALGFLGVGIGQVIWGFPWNWQQVALLAARSLASYQTECLALYIGLEAGAMSHSLSDVLGSAFKRLQSAEKSKKRQNKGSDRPRRSKPSKGKSNS